MRFKSFASVLAIISILSKFNALVNVMSAKFAEERREFYKKTAALKNAAIISTNVKFSF